MKNISCCAVLIMLSCGLALGQTYKVLWSFGGAPNDGAVSKGSLISDSAGNLYGTTSAGGDSTAPVCFGGCGTIFELSPNGDGTWSEAVLYSFCANYSGFTCPDGASPEAGLVFDSKGNIYGTTSQGGIQCALNSAGCGAVFELSPPALPGGNWTESVLHTFCSNYNNSQCLDGNFPSSPLTIDASGNLYGTTPDGGSGHTGSGINAGTVFELSPGLNVWTLSILYNFCSLGQGSFCPDGALPKAGVTFDNSGNLYGTTMSGGGSKHGAAGTVYELSPALGGWTERVVASFYPGNFGNPSPVGSVSFDSSGNLYGTTSSGGVGYGTVFKGTTNGTGRSFSFNGLNGSGPMAGVMIDPRNGNLYGTTEGTPVAFGNVFELGAKGKLTVLYSFCSELNCIDGKAPWAGLLGDATGNIYGTTAEGGANGLGVVFEITP